MPDGVWRRFLRSVGVVRQFPPPRVEGDAQARAVRGALEAFLARDEDRFRRLFLGGEPLVLADAERPWMEVLVAAGYVTTILAGAVRPCVRVFFLDELFIATDLLAHHDEDQVFSSCSSRCSWCDRWTCARVTMCWSCVSVRASTRLPQRVVGRRGSSAST